MNAWQRLALLCTLGLAGTVALAHEGEHGGAAPAAMTPPAPPPTTGTHDARTYFTDTVLLDQDGRRLRFYSDVLKDQVVLLNVVFTHCNDACPLITRKLREVREALGPEQAEKVLFVSLTSDPVNDTPEVLKAFTQKHGVAGQRWLFLTGTPQDMALVLGRLGHLVPSPEQHSTQLIAGDVANKRWSKIRPDAPANAIAQRLQLLAMPLAGR
ncbi:SCO1/SenC family protein [Pseudomonas knackmussii B13]|uniref:SCO1/SenC family protein n=1 Tax=Pseudomonas knackmussii (strain DSM 6978 / CCUG 54928 / LMG 23759 / B13) TaxID=1301098 RepID=A0A024HEX1_PSEKB|nr:SCO family protein [Pseudomonas knackmussii]CDF83421.1 SCO1/SenC family protein [Pseudomonas knackmussii B13]